MPKARELSACDNRAAIIKWPLSHRCASVSTKPVPTPAIWDYGRLGRRRHLGGFSCSSSPQRQVFATPVNPIKHKYYKGNWNTFLHSVVFIFDIIMKTNVSAPKHFEENVLIPNHVLQMSFVINCMYSPSCLTSLLFLSFLINNKTPCAMHEEYLFESGF